MGAPELDTDAAFILNIKAGNYFRRGMLLTDENDNPYDLSGATVIQLSVKKKFSQDDTDELFSVDLLALTQPDLANGIIWIIVADTVTTDTMVGRWKWDIRIKAPTIDSPSNHPDPAGEAVITGRVRRTD